MGTSHSPKRQAVLGLIPFLIVGCQSEPKVHWEEWKLVRTFEKSSKFPVTISTTEPTAIIKCGGKELGKGRATAEFEYSTTFAEYRREQFETRGTKSSRIGDETRNDELFVRSTPYIIEVEKEDFEKAVVPLVVPIPGDLKGKPYVFPVPLQTLGSSSVKEVDCTLTIIARAEYFEEIVHVLETYAVPSTARKEPIDKTNELRPQDQGLGIKKRVFANVIVRGITAFSRLVDALQSLAQTKNFVFGVTDVRLEATFNTNKAEVSSLFTISGNVRPDSRLFLIENGTQLRDARKLEVNTEGGYSTVVPLKEKQTQVYLISVFTPEGKYARPLAVFLRQTIWKGDGDKIIREDFEREAGVTVTDDDILELARR